MQKLTGIFYLTWLENKQDAFLSSAKFVGIDKRRHAAASFYPRDVLYEKGVDFVTYWI